MSRKMVLMNELIEEISMGPFGSDIKVDNFVKEGIPVLNGANINGVSLKDDFTNYLTIDKADTLKKANAKRGDIVITHRGTLGQIAYIPENSKFERYVISQSQFKVRLKKEKVNPIFFTYYFHTQEGQRRLLSFKNHVGVPALAQATTNFRQLEFPYIAINNQNQIAKVLSDLDAKIELNNKINAELEAMAKLIYDYWFVQFDFPNEEGKPYKSSGGKMVWNEELKREIPEGWEVKTLSSIADCNKWTLNKKSNFEYINYLDTSNLSQNVIENIITIDCRNEKVPSRAQRVIETNDVLISTVRPNQRHFGIIKNPIKNLIASSGFAQIRSKDEDISNDLIYIYLSSDRTTQRLRQISETAVSAYPSVSHNDIMALKIPLPSNKETLISINKILNDVYQKVSVTMKENQKLSELKDWLLPMLMNGQVKVK